MKKILHFVNSKKFDNFWLLFLLCFVSVSFFIFYKMIEITGHVPMVYFISIFIGFVSFMFGDAFYNMKINTQSNIEFPKEYKNDNVVLEFSIKLLYLIGMVLVVIAVVFINIAMYEFNDPKFVMNLIDELSNFLLILDICVLITMIVVLNKVKKLYKTINIFKTLKH